MIHQADLTILALLAAFIACVILGAMWADARARRLEQVKDDAPGFHHPERNGALPPLPKETESGRNGTPHRPNRGPKP